MTISKYLKLYKNEQITLLSENIMPVSDRHLTIYVTWNLSLKEIAQNDKTGKAIELLNLIAFCHFVDIPKPLLMGYLYGAVDNKSEIEFNKIIAFLRQYSLLKVTSDTVAIHHLVQDCIRSNLTSDEQKYILKKAIKTFKKIYPIEDKKKEDIELVKVLFPQMENFLTYKELLTPADRAILDILISDAYYFVGDYLKTTPLLQEALSLQKKDSENHNSINIASTLIRLGRSYENIGEYKKAEATVKEALEIEEKYYGTRNNIEVSEAINHLGMIYLWLGNYNKSKTLLEEALAIKEKHYGTRNNIKVADTIRWLGTAYLYIGNYEKSKTNLLEALKIQENYYGTRDNLDIASTLRRLSRSYLNNKEYKEAQILIEETLAIYRRHFKDSEHIDIGFILKDLGRIYVYKGEYDKAIPLLERSLEIKKQYYRVEKHMEYAFIWRELGVAYINLREFDKAKILLENTLSAREEYYKSDHPEIADTLYALAMLEHAKGENKNALILLSKGITMLEEYPGFDKNNIYLKQSKQLKQEILKSTKQSMISRSLE